MTADREALVAEVAGMLHRLHHQGLLCSNPECWELDKATEHADALADLLAAREQQARAEALREFGFWLEKNISSPAAHKAAYDRADQIEADA